MDGIKILTYLKELQENNNREFYHAHKNQYKEADMEFKSLIGNLMEELGKTDSRILQYAPQDLTFKLVRDTRFSHDKSPYNPMFRAHISPGGKLPIPTGYFVAISPGTSFLGGGLFADMFKDATEKIRNYIVAHGEELEAIAEELKKNGIEIQGTSLKNVPKGYDANHPQADYLKYKSWYIEIPVEDGQIMDMTSFMDFAMEKFLLIKPFNDYLNRALEGFSMPERT